MKKLQLLIVMMVGFLMPAFAQDTIVLYIVNHPSQMDLCVDNHQTVLVYAQDDCDQWYWTINYVIHDLENPIVIESEVAQNFHIVYYGCNYGHNFDITYNESHVPSSYTHTEWKRQAESHTLEAVGADSIGWPAFYQFHWSTGATTRTIDVTEPGTYTCEISELCGSATRTFIVRDNVEIYRSGVDPATNKNRVLWQTSPEQAEYISSVKIERDGMVVGTVPYTDGEFLDNIGSENAARIYKITAIDNNGDECPLPSYQFGTFNTIISPDIANPSLMNFTWEDPFIEEGSHYSVVAYRIGRFNEATGEFIMIDQLSANVHLGKYNMDLFDGDYGIVAAVFNDTKNRDYEELAFSNRSDNEIMVVGENETMAFKVYPNPANGILFVETRHGTSLPGETYRIMNPIGQTMMQGEITSEKQQIDVRGLPNGVYFITVGGATRKFVVE